jgi:hypothetical protein
MMILLSLIFLPAPSLAHADVGTVHTFTPEPGDKIHAYYQVGEPDDGDSHSLFVKEFTSCIREDAGGCNSDGTHANGIDKNDISYDTGSCFHAGGTLLLRDDNSTVKFQDVRLGDHVQTSDAEGRLSFSEVLFLPHPQGNLEEGTFITFKTQRGKRLSLTPDHYIPRCSMGGRLSIGDDVAESLNVGDCVRTIHGEEIITEIDSEIKRGIYTAVTADKYLVVDGIIASPFSRDLDPAHPKRGMAAYITEHPDYLKFKSELEALGQQK